MDLEDGSSITPDDYANLHKQMLKLQEENEKHAIKTICDFFDVPRSTYYKAMDKTISNRDQENHNLTGRILDIYNGSKGRYGTPKIHHILCKDGYLALNAFSD